MPDDDAEKMFLQEKPTLALLYIGSVEKTYASVISKEIDSTFAHTTRILSKMEQSGLIRFTFEGRIKFVELTGYGKKVEAALTEFRNVIEKEAPGKPEEEPVFGAENRENETLVSSLEEKEALVEEIKNLDPLSLQILDKIRQLQARIEKIHAETFEEGDEKDTVARKLGPYTRDIKRLQNAIEKSENPIDESVRSALNETSELLESYLRD